MSTNDDQIAKLDERISKLEIKSAVDFERHGSVIKRLDRIDGHVSKLIWIIITAIVAAFMTFILKGGLIIG